MTNGTNFSTASVYLEQDAEDQQLVRRCLEGDLDAFQPLVERYQRPFFTIAVRLLGDPDAAHDAVQDAFIKIYEKLGSFELGRRFFSWAYRILVNECLNARRARRPSEPVTEDLLVGASPLDRLALEERRRHVQQAILALPRDYREVVVLRHFPELSYVEISDAIGVPVKTVKSRLYTARQRLTEMLFEWDTRK